jgi:hypothetical protein
VDLDVRIEGADEIGGELALGWPVWSSRKIVWRWRLERSTLPSSMMVSRADSGSSERWDGGASDAARSDNRDFRGFQAPLADPAELRKHDLASVKLQFFVGEFAVKSVTGQSLPKPPDSALRIRRARPPRRNRLEGPAQGRAGRFARLGGSRTARGPY